VESTLVEVLILSDLGGSRFYKVVTWVGLKVAEES